MTFPQLLTPAQIDYCCSVIDDIRRGRKRPVWLRSRLEHGWSRLKFTDRIVWLFHSPVHARLSAGRALRDHVKCGYSVPRIENLPPAHRYEGYVIADKLPHEAERVAIRRYHRFVDEYNACLVRNPRREPDLPVEDTVVKASRRGGVLLVGAYDAILIDTRETWHPRDDHPDDDSLWMRELYGFVRGVYWLWPIPYGRGPADFHYGKYGMQLWPHPYGFAGAPYARYVDSEDEDFRRANERQERWPRGGEEK